ncbi:HEAT repeat domain-containing protein [Candidatus Binatia bacterium]|nr:HEAT repeat domain-containing protein [Candidatus Binatia bacterium]
MDFQPLRSKAVRKRRSAVLAIGVSLFLAREGASAAEYEVCVDVTPDIRALASDDLFESGPAEDRLTALGSAAWPALLRALEREGPVVRDGIIGILASAPEPGELVQKGVARVARSDPEPEVRATAVAALRKVAGKDSHDVVVAALEDPVATVRRKAITACKDLCTDDVALARLVNLALDDEPLSNALQAKRVLWGLTEDGRNRDIVERIRSATIAAPAASARSSGGAATEQQRALLAALLLAEIGDGSRLDDVARATRPGPSGAIRVHALHALGRLGGEDRVALVAGALQDPEVAVYAHDALRRMSERGVAGAREAVVSYTGPRAPQPLPRP